MQRLGRIVLLCVAAITCPAAELQSLHVIGPELRNGEVLRGPFGVTWTAAGHLLIADDLGHRIHHLDQAMSIVRTLGAGLALSYPDAASLVDGRYIIADTGKNRVLVYDPANGRSRSIERWWFQRLRNPRSVTAAGAGRWLVADWGNDVVREIDTNGELLTTFDANGSAAGALDGPIDAVRLPDGNVVVSDHRNDRLVVFDAQGGALRTLGEAGDWPGAFDKPAGLSVDRAGRLWVADSKNARVQVITTEGTVIAVLRHAGEDAFVRPTDVAVAANGLVAVADAGTHRVYVAASSKR